MGAQPGSGTVLATGRVEGNTMQAEGIPDLKQIHPFSRLAPGVCQSLQQRLRRVVISAKKHLVLHGERGSFLALISRGQVELLSPIGKTLTLSAGQSFGIGIAYHGLPSADSMVTRSEVVLWVILGSDWQSARSNTPQPASTPAPEPRSRKTLKRIFLTMALTGLALVILGAAPLETTHNLMTRLALDAGRPDLAEYYLRIATYLQPDYARIYDTLGYALFIQGKEEEALAVFTQAVLLDAEDAAAQNNLGVVLLQRAQIDQAIEHMHKAIDLHPGSPQAYFNLGNAYLVAGDFEAAARQYRMAFDLDANQLDAKAMWAGILLKKDQVEDARQAWEKVLSQDPAHNLALRGLGVIAFMEGQPEIAVTYLEAALISHPEDAVARFYLGLALQELGKTAEADAEFGAALANSRDPILSQMVKSSLLAPLR
jgi:Flp pilus assembly protein TadD